MARTVTREAPEAQNTGFVGSSSHSAHFTFGESMPTHIDMLSNMHQNNCQSPRISPDLQVADMGINTISYDAVMEKHCPVDRILSRSRSSTPVRHTNYDSHPLLDKPLSELAAEFEGDYINPEEYAKRSVEERQLQSKKEGGKVSRPLNSYMLYRKAYQQVARKVIQKDQQQSASQIVGWSWTKLERDGVKSIFRKLAKLDHDMHHEAFPDYKYTPNQGKSSRSSPDSKRFMTTQRRTLRRFEHKTANTKTLPTQMSNPTSVSSFIDDRGINASGYWLENRHDSAMSFPQNGTIVQHVSSAPSSISIGSQFDNEVNEMSPRHSSDQDSQVGLGSNSFDVYVDPSLCSSFDNVINQDYARNFQWQSRDFATGQELPLFMPLMSSDHLVNVESTEQGGWHL